MNKDLVAANGKIVSSSVLSKRDKLVDWRHNARGSKK